MQCTVDVISQTDNKSVLRTRFLLAAGSQLPAQSTFNRVPGYLKYEIERNKEKKKSAETKEKKISRGKIPQPVRNLINNDTPDRIITG